MQAGTIINSYYRECPEHCENCEHMESRYEWGSGFDGIGISVEEESWHECKLDRELCAGEIKDCPMVRDKILCLPEMCQSCQDVDVCQFQGLELKVNFDEIRDCFIQDYIKSGGLHVTNETELQNRESA